MDPNGSNIQVFDNLGPNFFGYAPSPADNKVAFGYTSTGTSNPHYAIMINTSVSLTGATTIDVGPYTVVGSLQFTPDGSKIIYVAQRSTENSGGVYVANTNGTGSPLRLDDADSAFLSPSGTVIVYSRVFTNTGNICRRNIDGTGFFRVTNGGNEDILPQWSKEGDRIYFSSNRSGNYDIWSMDADGGALTHLITTGENEYCGSPNSGNTEVTFTRISSVNSANTGVFKVPTAGSPTETSLFVSPDIDPFVYWTSTNGRAFGTGAGTFSHLTPRLRRLIFHR